MNFPVQIDVFYSPSAKAIYLLDRRPLTGRTTRICVTEEHLSWYNNSSSFSFTQGVGTIFPVPMQSKLLALQCFQMSCEASFLGVYISFPRFIDDLLASLAHVPSSSQFRGSYCLPQVDV
jgi:hypothetical protein